MAGVDHDVLTAFTVKNNMSVNNSGLYLNALLLWP